MVKDHKLENGYKISLEMAKIPRQIIIHIMNFQDDRESKSPIFFSPSELTPLLTSAAQKDSLISTNTILLGLGLGLDT
jgi:hypothetical protein